MILMIGQRNLFQKLCMNIIGLCRYSLRGVPLRIFTIGKKSKGYKNI